MKRHPTSFLDFLSDHSFAMMQALLLVPLLTTLAASQTVLQYGSGQLPSCAQNCQALTTANQACIPPAAPVNSQSIYNDCFCHSNFLASNLAVGSSSSVSNVCNSVCTSATDQLAIQNWYNALCKSTATTTAGVAATATATGTGSSTSSAATSTGTGSASNTSATQSSGQRWYGLKCLPYIFTLLIYVPLQVA